MNRTKILKTGMVALALAATVSLAGCSLGASNAVTLPPATATVTKGDITTHITASGNLSYPDTQDVRLEVGGTVSEVLVKAGDIVKEGDVMVKLGDSEIQDSIKAYEVSIANLEISLEKVVNKYRQLIYPYTYKTFAIDIPESVASINEAVRKVTDAQAKLTAANGADQSAAAADELRSALQDLEAATITLTFGQGDGIFQRAATGAISLTGTKFWDLRSAQLDIDSAQAQLDKAENDLASAKADLDKTVIKAPFDGLITSVPVTDGAIMNKGNVAVTMTNPDNLEADVLVNENDIFNVKINGTANVEVDAAEGLIVPATVTYIEPTATIQSGVVSYSVKVELTKSAGNATFTNLREGLSVTVNILKESHQNILLVLSKAITRKGTTASVQLVKADGTVETRVITTGSNDTKNTEVVQGLSEGDKVLLTTTTSTAATTATTGNAGASMGGLGGVMGGGPPAR